MGLIVRLIDLTLLKKNFLRDQGDARAVRVVDVPAFRGMMTDRRGAALAISTSVYSVWVNPKEFSENKKIVRTLSRLMNVPVETILSSIQKAKIKNREFLYLKRGLAPEIGKKIKQLSLHGMYLQQEYKRFYPEADIAAHVVGFTNTDDRGSEGLELAYDNWLAGTPGKEMIVKDRLGRVISNLKTIQTQKPGQNISLSIDNRIQYVAYRELMDGVQKNKAQSGSVVVLDIKTGEILAMVNQPSFNPNNRAGVNKENFRNRAVTDTFEPGSTIKTFSITSALDSGKYKMDTIIDTRPGWLRVGHNLVRDEHTTGLLTVARILQISSNVGITKIILSLPANQLWNVLQKIGFGETTEINFPGERSGLLPKRNVWSPFALATLSFGYGMSATPLQLAHAYAILANDGIKIPLSLLKIEKAPEGVQVINKDVSQQMMRMLETVVSTKDASGFPARIQGYRIAGKTGTARIVGLHGYEKHRHVSSFVGIAPASHPRIVIAVVVNDPAGKEYYGGLVSAPIFKKIMESTLRILNIPPDEVTTAS